MRFLRLILIWFLRALIAAYRYCLSPVLGPNCRYEPSCSAYAQDAITEHGPFAGSWLAIRRIFRCHPWGGAGYDPVPTANECSHNHGPAPAANLAKLPKG